MWPSKSGEISSMRACCPGWPHCRCTPAFPCWAMFRGGTAARSADRVLEFSDYRKYVPGDDTRRLDWRAYGRSDRFFIKEFEADTNLRMCLVVDTSGSMAVWRQTG